MARISDDLSTFRADTYNVAVSVLIDAAGIQADFGVLEVDTGETVDIAPYLTFPSGRSFGSASSSDARATFSGSDMTVTAVSGGDVYIPLTVVDDQGASRTVTIYLTTGVVVDVPLNNLVLPSVSGSAIVGQTLTANPGTWEGTGTITYAYQWRRKLGTGGTFTDISGQTGTTLVLDAGLEGYRIQVKVTATDDNETSGPQFSAGFPLVDTDLIVHVAPTLSGAGVATIDDITEGDEFTFSTAGAFTGLELSYAIQSGAVSGVSINASTGAVTVGTGTAVGDIDLVIRATNSGGFVDYTVATFSVVAIGSPSSITDGAVTWSSATTRTFGKDAAGKPYIVVPSGTEVITATPGVSTLAGDTINGLMVDPQRTIQNSLHALDERSEFYDAGLLESGSVTVTAGQVLLKCVSFTEDLADYNKRDGVGTYSALMVLDAAPPANAVLECTVGWTGRSAPGWNVVTGMADFIANRPKNTAPAGMPPFATLMNAFDQFAPVGTLNTSTVDGGYQALLPYGFGDGAEATPGAGGNKNFGRSVAEMMALIGVALTTDEYSDLEVEQIAWRLIQHGEEWYGPIKGSGVTVGADGGHNQWQHLAAYFYLSMTGQSAEIPNVFETMPGNFDQSFKVTTALIASDFSAHDDLSKPAPWRRRTLGAQPGGTTVTIPTEYNSGLSQGDWFQSGIARGSIITRPSDGATAVVQDFVNFPNAATGTADITIDAQPSPAFASSDVIYFEAPPGVMYDGGYDWALRGGYSFLGGRPSYFSPDKDVTYRSQVRHGPIIAALKLLDIYDESLDAVRGYAARAILADEPSALNDYQFPADNWEASPDLGETYTAAADYLSAMWLLAFPDVGFSPNGYVGSQELRTTVTPGNSGTYTDAFDEAGTFVVTVSQITGGSATALTISSGAASGSLIQRHMNSNVSSTVWLITVDGAGDLDFTVAGASSIVQYFSIIRANGFTATGAVGVGSNALTSRTLAGVTTGDLVVTVDALRDGCSASTSLTYGGDVTEDTTFFVASAHFAGVASGLATADALDVTLSRANTTNTLCANATVALKAV